MEEEEEELKGWKKSNYGVQPPMKCPFEEGNWYEIGWYNEYLDNFIHQGIRKYEEYGFMDDNNYQLKPFPTHFKKLELSEPNQTELN